MPLTDPASFPFGQRRTFRQDEGTRLSILEHSLSQLSLSSWDKKDLNDDDGDNDDSVRTGPLGLNALNCPPEPLVELVFVHGLGGGSRKSWSQTKHEDHFWPKSWLSRDPDFYNVRIHSFGYRSTKAEIVSSPAGIPDYAESLVIALRDSPLIRRTQSAIILVGHSMGGLVVKKAFIRAHDTNAFESLATRIKSLYFLGTPHAGSDLSQTFKSLFRLLPLVNTTENIADIDPNSRLLESLHVDFPEKSREIEIRTFWETKPSAMLGPDGLVVPKRSACLYYTNEVRDGLDSDHRGMCKYDKPTDPNYIKVRNALSATVEKFVREHLQRNQGARIETSHLLRDFLSYEEAPEDDLEGHCEACLNDNTCSWFTSGEPYLTWRDHQRTLSNSEEIIPDLMVVEAEPGAGKSVLAAQVINNLQALNCDCSYYFFDSQDRQKSNVSRLIRSLAVQMAILNPNVRESLLKLLQQNVRIPNENDKALWRTLFSKCIFQRPLDRPHYWVIDALDECPLAASLLQMFLRIDEGTHLKIFITTRSDDNIHRELLRFENRVTHLPLSKTATLASMRDYVEQRSKQLRLRKEKDRFELVRSILDNADGSFLWVKLVLDDVSKATGPQEIRNSMEKIPRGMDLLYADIVHDLKKEIPTEEIEPVKAFLSWTLCTNPPLTVEELEAALKLEQLDKSVDRMCDRLRNLIIIDHGKRVRAVHNTARKFLLTASIDSDFVISSSAAHKRIARLLLKHLRTNLRGIRNADHLRHFHRKRAGLDNYALLYFSDHVRRSLEHDRRVPVEDHSLFFDVADFFADCGSNWIACIASQGSLDPLVKTSQNLRHWLQSRSRSIPSLGELAPKTTRLQQWSVDLVRLVAKFGRHLLEFPGSMYGLVPPFVPKESVLYVQKPRQARGQRQISVTGLNNDRWDDRLCSIFYEGTICTAIASGRTTFAVAMKNGIINIYDNDTLQISRTFRHGAVVKLLKYDDTGSMLLSGGFRKLSMWSLQEGTQMWDVAIRNPRLSAEFIQEKSILISISSQHKLIKQDVATGATIKISDRKSSLASEGADEPLGAFRRELQYAEFSAQASMLATMERERPIQLTDIEDQYDVGIVELDLSDDGECGTLEQPITAMTFCANLDVALLAVVYRDGTLAAFDRDVRLIEKRGDNKAVSILAGSPDGLTLAAATVEGVITLYDFEQLIPLHVLFTSSIEHIRSLVFSGDGQRIIDIRDRQANIWAPSALVNRIKEDSDTISESTLSPTVATSNWTGLKDGLVDITAILAITNSDRFICGREDGSIVIQSTNNPEERRILYTHTSKQWVGKIVWLPKSHILATISGTSTVTVFALASDLTIMTILHHHTFLHPVLQLLFQVTAEFLRMAVVTTRTIDLWRTECPLTEQCLLTEVQVRPLSNSGLFLEDANDSGGSSEYLTLMRPDGVKSFSWEGLEARDDTPILFSQTPGRAPADPPDTHEKGVATFDRATSLPGDGRRILLRSVSLPHVDQASPSGSIPTRRSNRERWIIDDPPPESATSADALLQPTGSTKAGLHARLLPVSHLIEHVIGFRKQGRQLIFLSKALWICSYDMVAASHSNRLRRSSDDQRSLEYTRHLFIPDDWISSTYSNATSQLLFVLGGIAGDSLLFVKQHEVAVIKEPFSHAERIQI